jgi:hypothetical protein
MSIHGSRAIFVAVGFLLFDCASTPNHITRSKSSAVVVVNALRGLVDDVAVTINARNGKTGAVPIPSPIVWVVDDPTATLMIEFLDPHQDCVRGKHCEGPECHAVTNVNSTGSRCEYKVWINNSAAKDPVVIVENCCP